MTYFQKMNEDQLRRIFKAFNHFMLILWRLGLGSYGNGTRYGGAVMVLKHTGRRSGLVRQTPLNYAIIDNDIYCMAGFGRAADWYRNIQANPQVEVWLPDSRWEGIAEDVSEAEYSAAILRQVMIASGFAAPLFGMNPNKLSDQELEEMLKTYRLLRIRRSEARTGPGGPGDLAWVWPVATFALLGALLVTSRKKKCCR